MWKATFQLLTWEPWVNVNNSLERYAAARFGFGHLAFAPFGPGMKSIEKDVSRRRAWWRHVSQDSQMNSSDGYEL